MSGIHEITIDIAFGGAGPFEQGVTVTLNYDDTTIALSSGATLTDVSRQLSPSPDLHRWQCETQAGHRVEILHFHDKAISGVVLPDGQQETGVWGGDE